MTAYLARRELRLRETVVAPAYAALPAESLLGLQSGEQIQVRDLLYGLLLVSGNDAAVALAEAVSGSEEAFVAEMNEAADRLGLDHTSYGNPIGLDEPDNYSSARDLVELAARLRRDRFLAEVFDTAEYDTVSGAASRHLVNRNMLVLTTPWIDGVKTGHTLGAGYVLVASGRQRGVDLVAAVLGAPGEAERDQATLALLEHGFSLYRTRSPVEEGQRVESAEIRYQDERLELIAAGALSARARSDQELEVDIEAPAEVEGPIERGDRLGRATLLVDGEAVDRVALRAARAVPEAGLLDRLDSAVPGPRAVAVLVVIVGLALALAAVLVVFVRRRERPS